MHAAGACPNSCLEVSVWCTRGRVAPPPRLTNKKVGGRKGRFPHRAALEKPVRLEKIAGWVLVTGRLELEERAAARRAVWEVADVVAIAAAVLCDCNS